MVREITCYACGVCGRFFLTRKGAEQCESYGLPPDPFAIGTVVWTWPTERPESPLEEQGTIIGSRITETGGGRTVGKTVHVRKYIIRVPFRANPKKSVEIEIGAGTLARTKKERKLKVGW